VRKITFGCLCAASLAVLAGPDAASARWYDFPNSGRCPVNLIRATNLRACVRFDRYGHRVSNGLVPMQEFRKYGVSRLRYD
jgi:hypothetical protein